jgi:hypothetical protein
MKTLKSLATAWLGLKVAEEALALLITLAALGVGTVYFMRLADLIGRVFRF